MKVKDLLVLLAQCDPEAEFVYNAPFKGFEQVNAVVRRKDHYGVGDRYSFEAIPTVEAVRGDIAHMMGQGVDVLGANGDPGVCKCNSCAGHRGTP